jgi:WD40 repeat protein
LPGARRAAIMKDRQSPPSRENGTMTALRKPPAGVCCGALRLLAVVVVVALAVLAGSLAPAQSGDDKKVDDKKISKLIDQLGDDDEDVRKKAEKELLALGEAALAPLQKAAKDHADADVRLRAIVLSKAVARGAFRELKKMTGHTGWVRSIAVSKDGKKALTGSQDHTARVWDLDKGTEVGKFTKHTSWTWEVAFSPDEKQALSSGGLDKTLRLWDVDKLTEVRQYTGFPLRAYAAAFSPDGKYVLGSEAGRNEEDMDGKNNLRLYDADSGKLLRQFVGHTGYVWRAFFSPDGKKIASVGCNDQTFRVWDPETAKCLVTGKDAHDGNVVGLAWTPDSKYVLTSGRDRTCKLWDAETGKLAKTFTGFSDDVEAVAISKDGKRFLAGETKVVHVVDMDSAKIVHRFEEHTDGVLAVAWLPDGLRALSGGKDNTVRLWRVPK